MCNVFDRSQRRGGRRHRPSGGCGLWSTTSAFQQKKNGRKILKIGQITVLLVKTCVMTDDQHFKEGK